MGFRLLPAPGEADPCRDFTAAHPLRAQLLGDFRQPVRVVYAQSLVHGVEEAPVHDGRDFLCPHCRRPDPFIDAAAKRRHLSIPSLRQRARIKLMSDQVAQEDRAAPLWPWHAREPGHPDAAVPGLLRRSRQRHAANGALAQSGQVLEPIPKRLHEHEPSPPAAIAPARLKRGGPTHRGKALLEVFLAHGLWIADHQCNRKEPRADVTAPLDPADRFAHALCRIAQKPGIM